ncbi:MAG TPA: site-2 protease family protein [Tepidisphaeraceae bacterium]|jgi:hypothetical protein
MLCPECLRRRKEAAFRKGFAVWFLAGVASLLAAEGKSMRWPANLLLWVMFEYVCIVPHELAHAAAALLARMEVFQITFGTGRRWGHLCVWGMLIECRALPVCGSVSCAGLSMRAWRLRRLAVVAAGPMSNVALCLVAVWVAGGWRRLVAVDWSEHIAPWLMLALANAMLVLGPLLRRRAGIPGIPTDGVQFYRLLFRPLPSESQRRLSYFVSKAHALLNARAYEQLDALVLRFHDELSPSQFLHWRGIAEAELGNFDAAKASLIKLLELHFAPGVERAISLNAIAWNDLVIGASDLLPEADRFSAEAYSLMPWNAAVQSTRGWALVELGDLLAGMPLLRESLRGVAYNHDRASVLCTLAIAEGRRGRRRYASELLRQARRLDARCALLARAERELSGIATAT